MGRSKNKKSIGAMDLDVELVAALDDYCCNHPGESKTSVISQALQNMLTDSLISLVPDQAKAIEDFQFHVGSILDAYRSSLMLSATADDRAKQAVSSELKGLGTLADRCKTLENENKELKKRIQGLEAQVDHMESPEIVSELRSEILGLKSEKATLVEEHANEKNKLLSQIAGLQQESRQTLLDLLKFQPDK